MRFEITLKDLFLFGYFSLMFWSLMCIRYSTCWMTEMKVLMLAIWLQYFLLYATNQYFKLLTNWNVQFIFSCHFCLYHLLNALLNFDITIEIFNLSEHRWNIFIKHLRKVVNWITSQLDYGEWNKFSRLVD